MMDPEYSHNFKLNAPKYWHKITEMSLKISGKFNLNHELASEWINQQLTPLRQHCCQTLLDQIHYVTFEETISLIANVVDKTVSKIKSKTKIYILMSSKNRSNFLFGVIGYHFLLESGISAEQITVINLLSDFDVASDTVLLLFDDFSYTGSQLAGSVKSILKQISQPFDFYVCLVGLTSTAKDHLSGGPFQVIYGFEETSLQSKLSQTDYINLCYFFQPYTEPVSCVYFDHKVADQTSSLAYILKFGAVIPADYRIFRLGSLGYRWSIRSKFKDDEFEKDYFLAQRSKHHLQPLYRSLFNGMTYNTRDNNKNFAYWAVLLPYSPMAEYDRFMLVYNFEGLKPKDLDYESYKSVILECPLGFTKELYDEYMTHKAPYQEWDGSFYKNESFWDLDLDSNNP